MERKLRELEKEEEEEAAFYSPENREVYNDENEKRKVDHLRFLVENQDPTCKEVDDATLRRFLQARDHNVEKASRMFLKYSEWRRRFSRISESEVQNQIALNKVFVQGRDKRGCPIGIIFGAKHFPSKRDFDELIRFVVFSFDRVCSRMENGQEKFTVIADLKGYGYSNIDIHGYTAGLSIFQDYYPERLQKCLFVNVPYIFMAAWKIVYPFIDKNIKKKIVFVENKKVESTLLEEIDEIYGGKLKLVPIQDA